MRIISGKYGRRRFDVPTNIKARPTTDFARRTFSTYSKTWSISRASKPLIYLPEQEPSVSNYYRANAAGWYAWKFIRHNTILSAKSNNNSTTRIWLLSREMCSSSYKAAGNNSTSFLPIRLTICPGWKPCRRKCYREVFWNRVESSFSNIPKTMIFPLTPYSTSTVVTGAWTSRSSARRYNTIRKEPWPNTRSWLLSYARQIP